MTDADMLGGVQLVLLATLSSSPQMPTVALGTPPEAWAHCRVATRGPSSPQASAQAPLPSGRTRPASLFPSKLHVVHF